jgi:hypothetical protein
MKWTWDGGFRAHTSNEDGTRTEKVFTSEAQARQFVEQEENVQLAGPHKPPRVGAAKFKMKFNLTSEERRLKEEALKMFTVKKTGELI